MRYHLISGGKNIMPDLAIALADLGNLISVSSLEFSRSDLSKLENAQSVSFKIGFDEKQVNSDLDAVIIDSMVAKDNPELKKALVLGLKIESLASFIADFSKNKNRMVICGSNGKTTATAMAMHCLKRQKMTFDYVVGANVHGFNSKIRLSDAPVIILDASDEPASALDSTPEMVAYRPAVVACTGIAFDDTLKGVSNEKYLERYGQLIDSLPEEANFIWFREDVALKKLVDARKETAKFYSAPFEIFPTEYIRGMETIKIWGKPRAPMVCFGRHNMVNAKAGFMICRELGPWMEDYLRDLAVFPGIENRLEVLSETKKSAIWKDLADSPTRLDAAVSAVRALHPNRTLTVCFEMSSQKNFDKAQLTKFKRLLEEVEDVLIFCSPEFLKNSKLKSEEIEDAFGHSNLSVFFNPDSMVDALKDLNLDGHNILFMSAGDFGGLDLRETAKDLL